MTDRITVRIITPEALLFEKQASEVILTGPRGDFAILPKRAPLAAELVASKMTLKNGAMSEHCFITSGMVEFSDNECNILVEAAVSSDNVPKEKLQARLAELQKIIKDQPAGLIYDELADHIAFIKLALG